MTKNPPSTEDKEIARRRDAVALRMLKTPPKPHKDEPKKRDNPRKRAKKDDRSAK